jgi:rhodanese-related sulfurtransferase
LISRLEPGAVAAWRDDPARESPVLVDVREDWERAICAIDGAIALPMQEIARRVGELPRERDLVIVCHSGRRSAAVASWLGQQGFRAHNLEGGVDAWARTVDPSMRRY